MTTRPLLSWRLSWLNGFELWLELNYENTHYPISEAEPREALQFLIEEHGLKQTDLPEIDRQGVVSEILAGKRAINAREAKALSERFHVSLAVFI